MKGISLCFSSLRRVAHYAISDLAGNLGGHGTEFLLSVFTLLLLFALLVQ